MTAKPRTTTAVRFTPEIHTRLADEAEAREVSMNWLVNRAVVFYLDRLLPADEIQWTHEPSNRP